MSVCQLMVQSALSFFDAWDILLTKSSYSSKKNAMVYCKYGTSLSISEINFVRQKPHNQHESLLRLICQSFKYHIFLSTFSSKLSTAAEKVLLMLRMTVGSFL